jgi:hypothetical protein
VPATDEVSAYLIALSTAASEQHALEARERQEELAHQEALADLKAKERAEEERLVRLRVEAADREKVAQEACEAKEDAARKASEAELLVLRERTTEQLRREQFEETERQEQAKQTEREITLSARRAEAARHERALAIAAERKKRIADRAEQKRLEEEKLVAEAAARAASEIATQAAQAFKQVGGVRSESVRRPGQV